MDNQKKNTKCKKKNVYLQRGINRKYTLKCYYLFCFQLFENDVHPVTHNRLHLECGNWRNDSIVED